MRVLTITELMRLTRTKLCALLTRIANELPPLPGRLGRTRKRAREHRQYPPRARPPQSRSAIAREAPAGRRRQGAVLAARSEQRKLSGILVRDIARSSPRTENPARGLNGQSCGAIAASAPSVIAKEL